MQAAADTYHRHQADTALCEAELLKLKDRAINEYKKNLITEKDYHTLNEKIKEYIGELQKTTR
jgi:hemerythrin superfamily protein